MAEHFVTRLKELEQLITADESFLHTDGLLDAIIAVLWDARGSKLKGLELFKSRFEKHKSHILDRRVKKSDFDVIKTIGSGAFGIVRLVRCVHDKQLYAMKVMSKVEMLKRSETAFFMEERDVMARANSPWIVQLFYAFQDPRNLIMIMEYLPGGDLMCLIDYNTIDEDMACFYAAEMVLAVEVVHNLGFIHRDVKPDNLLLDNTGHIKLADFNTCTKVDNNGRTKTQHAIGTPDYLSPEVLQSEGNETSYGREVDWWACGIVLYELFYKETPFFDDTLVKTYSNIMNHDRTLQFPTRDPPISDEGVSLVRAFVCKQESRIGYNRGAQEVKEHPFFHKNRPWTFENIRSTLAPVIPTLEDEEDTRYFSDVDSTRTAAEAFPDSADFKGNHLPFVGFTYNRDYDILRNANTGATSSLVPNSSASGEELSVERDRLNRRLAEQKQQLETALQAEKQARDERTRLDAELRTTTMELETTKAELDSSISRVTALVNENEELNRQQEALLKETTSSTQETERDRKRLDDLTEQRKKLKEDVQRLHAEVTTKDARVTELQGRLDELMVDTTGLNEQLTQQAVYLSEMEAKKTEAEQKGQEAAKQISKLQLELSHAKVKLEHFIARQSGLSEAIGDNGQRRSSTSDESAAPTSEDRPDLSAKGNASFVQAEIDELQERLNAQEIDLVNARSDRDNYSSQLEEARRSAAAQLLQLQSTMDAERQRNETIRTKQEASIQQLTAKCVDAESRLERLLHELEEKSDDVETWRTLYEDMKKMHDRERKGKEEEVSKIAVAKEETKQALARVAQVERQDKLTRSQLNETINRLRSELSQAIDDKTEEIRTLHEEISEKNIAIDQLQEDVAYSSSQLQTVSERLNEIEAEKAKLTSQLADSLVKIQGLAGERRSLIENMEKLADGKAMFSRLKSSRDVNKKGNNSVELKKLQNRYKELELERRAETEEHKHEIARLQEQLEALRKEKQDAIDDGMAKYDEVATQRDTLTKEKDAIIMELREKLQILTTNAANEHFPANTSYYPSTPVVNDGLPGNPKAQTLPSTPVASGAVGGTLQFGPTSALANVPLATTLEAWLEIPKVAGKMLLHGFKPVYAVVYGNGCLALFGQDTVTVCLKKIGDNSGDRSRITGSLLYQYDAQPELCLNGVVHVRSEITRNDLPERKHARTSKKLNIENIFHIIFDDNDVQSAEGRGIRSIYSASNRGETNQFESTPNADQMSLRSFGESSMATQRGSISHASRAEWKEGVLCFKDHEFLSEISFRLPATCDSCQQPCWNALKPPRVYQCKLCHYKLHASHFVQVQHHPSVGQADSSMISAADDTLASISQSSVSQLRASAHVMALGPGVRVAPCRAAPEHTKQSFIKCPTAAEHHKWVRVMKTLIRQPGTGARSMGNQGGGMLGHTWSTSAGPPSGSSERSANRQSDLSSGSVTTREQLDDGGHNQIGAGDAPPPSTSTLYEPPLAHQSTASLIAPARQYYRPETDGDTASLQSGPPPLPVSLPPNTTSAAESTAPAVIFRQPHTSGTRAASQSVVEALTEAYASNNGRSTPPKSTASSSHHNNGPETAVNGAEHDDNAVFACPTPPVRQSSKTTSKHRSVTDYLKKSFRRSHIGDKNTNNNNSVSGHSGSSGSVNNTGNGELYDVDNGDALAQQFKSRRSTFTRSIASHSNIPSTLETSRSRSQAHGQYVGNMIYDDPGRLLSSRGAVDRGSGSGYAVATNSTVPSTVSTSASASFFDDRIVSESFESSAIFLGTRPAARVNGHHPQQHDRSGNNDRRNNAHDMKL